METLIYRHQQEYYDALLEAGRRADSTVFVEFMLGVIRDAMIDVKQQQGVASDGQAIASDRQAMVLAYAQEKGMFRVADVAELLGIRSQRARTVVSGMVAKGALVKHGNGRYSYNTLAG